jgi:hypothetical protein
MEYLPRTEKTLFVKKELLGEDVLVITIMLLVSHHVVMKKPTQVVLYNQKTAFLTLEKVFLILEKVFLF